VWLAGWSLQLSTDDPGVSVPASGRTTQRLEGRGQSLKGRGTDTATTLGYCHTATATTGG
jgi:hypothetical protein